LLAADDEGDNFLGLLTDAQLLGEDFFKLSVV